MLSVVVVVDAYDVDPWKVEDIVKASEHVSQPLKGGLEWWAMQSEKAASRVKLG